MASLQRTIHYQGDLDNVSGIKVKLDFSLPDYGYAPSPQSGNVPIIRTVAGRESSQLTTELAAGDYRIDFSNTFILGTAELDAGSFYKYFLYSLDSRKLANFTTEIEVTYLINETTEIGRTTLGALYFFPHTRPGSPAVSRVPLREFDLEGLFLINQSVYTSLLQKLADVIPNRDDFYLLDVIGRLVNLSAGYPFLETALSEESRTAIFQLLGTDQMEPVELIMKRFPDLFDFPLDVPELRTVEVAGTFTVLTDDNRAVNENELPYFDLLVEYSVDHAGAGAYRARHFDWSTVRGKLQDNSVGFSLTDGAKILQNNIRGPLTVQVKGFDGSLLWSRQYAPDSPELSDLAIAVPLLTPVRLSAPEGKNPEDVNKKLRGQVVVTNKDCSLKGVTVTLRAKKKGSTTRVVVGTARADDSGYFFMPYPYGNYTEAQAVISLIPNEPVEVAISKDDAGNQSIAEDFLYFLVTTADCPPRDTAADCDCHTDAPRKAPRLPDHSDLINSSEFSQDLGGACVNLSIPNRTLREYSYQAVVRTSDPSVSNYTLKKIKKTSSVAAYATLVSEYLGGTTTESPIDTRFELVPSAVKIIRKPVDLDNPIRWQDAPDNRDNLQIYQAVTIATGHILHYRSQFKADGYSLGDLLYSLALAPGQKKQIVVMDSSHSLLGAETQQITQDERLVAGLRDERGITDQLGGNINEAMQGRSSANTSGISAGGGLGFSYGGIGASLGVAGGSSSSDASASQNSARNVSQFFGEKLRHAITQNAEGYRQLNASVVTSVQENHRYSATTEVVANHNHCHALTILYFEVLRHFAVYQELSSVEECVFVPLLLTNFTVDNIYKWRDILAPGLLPTPSNTFLRPLFSGGRYQHPLLRGFDANERIKNNYANVDFPKGKYSEETINSVQGFLTIRANIPRPKTRFDRILSLPIIRKTVTTQGGVDIGGTIQDNIKSSVVGALTGGLSLLFGGGPSVKYNTDTHEVLTPGKIFDLFMNLDENYESVPPAHSIRVHNFEPVPYLEGTTIKHIDFFGQNQDDFKLWDAYASILDMTVYELLNKFSGNVISDWDKIFFDDIAPQILKHLVSESTIRFNPLGGLDLTATSRYSGREQLLRYNFRASTTLARKDILKLDILYTFNASVRNQARLINEVTLNVEDLTVYYSTNHYSGKLFSGYVGDDLLDGGVHNIQSPLNFDEQRNPRMEDIFIVDKLVEHLNSNLEYYNKLLWFRLDPDRRYMLLDGFSIELYNDYGVKVPSRSLASVVKNELITVAGNSLVFPVAPGYKVSMAYLTETTQDESEVKVTLFDHYKPLTPIEPYRISVPTKGVFAETLQSYCNACEKIETDRLQDWNKFPNTDEPTPFVPVVTPTPTITDWKAAFKDFAPPMINIQNAPNEPAPGAGLAGLNDLMGKSGVFKDITGLDATQQTALKTYLSNQENAKAFAEMAKELAMQQHNTDHSAKISDSLKSAKDAGAISQDDYGKLTKEHLQQQIDGGKAQSQQDLAQKSKQVASPIAAAVDLAKTRQGDFSATETTPDGVKTANFKSKSDGSLLYDFVVPGTLTPIKQSTPNACWATVATMMANWKKQRSQTVDDYIASVGAQYVSYITTGIPLDKLSAFATATGLKLAYTNTEYPVSYYYDVLRKNGPIWVIDLESADPSMLHGRLLVGIKGDDSSDSTVFTLIDPATGSQYTESLATFIQKTENVVKTIDAVKDAQIPLLVFYRDTYDQSALMDAPPSGNATIGSPQAIPLDIATKLNTAVAAFSNNNPAALGGLETKGGFTYQLLTTKGSPPIQCYFLRFADAIFVYRADWNRICEVHGTIYKQYKAFGFDAEGKPKSSPGLGLPISDEIPWLVSGNRVIGSMSQFEKGVIYWRQRDNKVFKQAIDTSNLLYWGIDSTESYTKVTEQPGGNVSGVTGYVPCYKGVYFRGPLNKGAFENTAKAIDEVFAKSDGLCRVLLIDNSNASNTGSLLGTALGKQHALAACGRTEFLLEAYADLVATKYNRTTGLQLPDSFPIFGDIEPEVAFDSDYVRGWLEGFAEYNASSPIMPCLPGLYISFFRTRPKNIASIDAVNDPSLLLWAQHPNIFALTEKDIFEHGFTPDSPKTKVCDMWQFNNGDARFTRGSQFWIDHNVVTAPLFDLFWEGDQTIYLI